MPRSLVRELNFLNRWFVRRSFVREKSLPKALICAPLSFSAPLDFLLYSLLRSERKSGLVLPCAMGNAVV